MANPVLASMVRAMGLEKAPHYTAATPKIQAYRDRWVERAPLRDGRVSPHRTEVSDPAEIAKQIKAKAMELGAHMVGVCRLQPQSASWASWVTVVGILPRCGKQAWCKLHQPEQPEK